MAPKLTFKIELHVENGELLPELAARVNDLRPAFDEIIEKWARNNREKFMKSSGHESSGAQVDPTVFWEPLKQSTSFWKRKHGFPDQIMVRTGELELALEDTEGFFSATTPQEAVFGTPKSLDDEMKVRYNWEKRPAIFLGVQDQKMIESVISNYLNFGENWKEIMFGKGLENIRNKQEASSMDVEFNDMIASTAS